VQVRKTIKFNQLHDNELRDHPAIPFSNLIQGENYTSFEKHATPGTFVLLSCFSLSAVGIALELNKKNPADYIPQLFFIDHGLQPSKLWFNLKRFFTAIGTRTDAFSLQLQSFLEANAYLYCFNNNTQEIINHNHQKILELIDRFGYAAVRTIITKGNYVAQDWKDHDTFTKLQEFIEYKNYQQTIVYASNIVSNMRENVARKILENIYYLKPAMSIHQNHNMALDKPDFCRVVFKEGNQPTKMFADISADISLEGLDAVRPFHAQNQVYLNRQAYFNTIHTTLETQLLAMQKQHNYIFNHHNSPMLLDVIFSMAGFTGMAAAKYKFQSSRYTDNLIFHMDVTEEQAENYLQSLQYALPYLNANFAHMGEAQKLAKLPISICFNSYIILHEIIPRIPDFLANQTNHKAIYEYYAFTTLIDAEFSRLTAKDNHKVTTFAVIAMGFLPLIVATAVAFANDTDHATAYIFSLIVMLSAELTAAYQFSNILYRGHHRFENTPLGECSDELKNAASVCLGDQDDTTPLHYVKDATLSALQPRHSFFQAAAPTSPHTQDSKPWRFSL
jgi:hypothetical protein